MITQMKKNSDSKINQPFGENTYNFSIFLSCYAFCFILCDATRLWRFCCSVKDESRHISIELEKNCSSDGSVRYWKIFHFLVLLLCLVRLTDACSHGGFTKALLVSVRTLSLVFGFRSSPWFYPVNLSLPESFH